MSKKLLKLLVPACMILGVGGLWYMHKGQEIAPTAAVAPVTDIQHSDFALVAQSIDLKKLQEHKLPMIIDFGADACVPCKAMAPVLVKLNAQMQNKAIIKFVDVWKNPNASQGFPVQVIPTQIIVNADGTPYVPKDVDDVKFIMYSSKDTKEHTFTVHQGGLTEDQMLSILEDMGIE